MLKKKDIFLEDSQISFDLKHRKTLNFNISRYDKAVKKGKLRYRNMELAKQRASYLKKKVGANLSDYLIEFEKNTQNNGIHIIWARNGEGAVSEIIEVLKENKAKVLVKSKSLISEEIELNEKLEKVGFEPVKIDLGEFIVQVVGEKPYPILIPAMHKSKEDVAELFNKKFNTLLNSTPEDITVFVRNVLRKKFTSAEIGVTGANFLVADVGGVVLTENEGNGLIFIAFPKVHVVISGIEKISSSINDLQLMLPQLSAFGTGQQVTVYNSLDKRGNLDRINGEIKNILLKVNKNVLGKEKEFPAFYQKSFSKNWKLNLK